MNGVGCQSVTYASVYTRVTACMHVHPRNEGDDSLALPLGRHRQHVPRDVAADPHVARLLDRLPAQPGPAPDVEDQGALPRLCLRGVSTMDRRINWLVG